ncbi:biogenesis of lysosome-related organelles complex 1 subunit 1-like isoform X1 [Littorina saxatilis]|uniref:biogenesis of lysosome-related organelles complex 1 subunit 1-like isoform X1 n=1 Tax=Littorina saxatilis TaxID=31220 RepID=UPI0038B57F65
MLSSLVKQHQTRQQARKELQEKRKRDAIVAATALSHVLVDHLNAGVAQAYVNQKKLDTETRILHTNAAQFSKQTLQWLKLIDDFNTALKVQHVATEPPFKTSKNRTNSGLKKEGVLKWGKLEMWKTGQRASRLTCEPYPLPWNTPTEKMNDTVCQQRNEHVTVMQIN